MLPMPNSLSNEDDNSTGDFNVQPGNKRKLREGFETSGLAKKLVFWSVIYKKKLGATGEINHILERKHSMEVSSTKGKDN